MPYQTIPVTGLVLGPIGSISQTDFPLVSARQVNSTDTLNINFGDPFVLNANNTYSSVAQFIATYGVFALLSLAEANPSDPFGIAKDSAQTNAYYPLNGGTHMPAGFYAPGMMVNGLTRGTAAVAINHGTPVGAGSPVYIRTVPNAAIPAGLVGGFEASPEGTVSYTHGTNVGNGTVTNLALGPYAQETYYTANPYTITLSSATAFAVADPLGRWLGLGTVGVPFVGSMWSPAPGFSGSQITFTVVAGATPFAAGDQFQVLTSMNTLFVRNMVFKTGILSVDPNTSQVAAEITILERKIP